MNEILKKHGDKAVSTTERNIEFSENQKTTAQDFLWHIKRIHHWWNCAGKTNQTPPLDI